MTASNGKAGRTERQRAVTRLLWARESTRVQGRLQLRLTERPGTQVHRHSHAHRWDAKCASAEGETQARAKALSTSSWGAAKQGSKFSPLTAGAAHPAPRSPGTAGRTRVGPPLPPVLASCVLLRFIRGFLLILF